MSLNQQHTETCIVIRPNDKSQSNVVLSLRCWVFDKEYLKSVNIWQDYGKKVAYRNCPERRGTVLLKELGRDLTLWRAETASQSSLIGRTDMVSGIDEKYQTGVYYKLQIRSVKRGICPIASPQRPNCSYNMYYIYLITKGLISLLQCYTYIRIILHIFHCACAKRLYVHFRSKIWRLVLIVFLDPDFL